MKTQTATITGMSCPACEKLISRRVGSLEGVENVSVDVQNGTATIVSQNGLSQEDIAGVLEGTHYTLTSL